jgi:two-component system response regulator
MNKRQFILVAEDDIDDKCMLQMIFEDSGKSNLLEFVNNGLELINFLDHISQHEDTLVYPHFILLDLNMPKMDGRQTLKELKDHHTYKKIPVIIFSTTKNEAEIARCYELGANSYIVKPHNYKDLLQIMDMVSSYWLNTAALPDIKLSR